jgi:hypothetical protein
MVGKKTHSWPCSTKKWNPARDPVNLPANLADSGKTIWILTESIHGKGGFAD